MKEGPQSIGRMNAILDHLINKTQEKLINGADSRLSAEVDAIEAEQTSRYGIELRQRKREEALRINANIMRVVAEIREAIQSNSDRKGKKSKRKIAELEKAEANLMALTERIRNFIKRLDDEEEAYVKRLTPSPLEEFQKRIHRGETGRRHSINGQTRYSPNMSSYLDLDLDDD